MVHMGDQDPERSGSPKVEAATRNGDSLGMLQIFQGSDWNPAGNNDLIPKKPAQSGNVIVL